MNGRLSGASLPHGMPRRDALADGREPEEVKGGAPGDLAALAGVVGSERCVESEEVLAGGQARGPAWLEGRGEQVGRLGEGGGGERGEEIGEVGEGVACR